MTPDQPSDQLAGRANGVLLHEAGSVCLDGPVTDVEVACDLLAALASDEQLRDLPSRGVRSAATRRTAEMSSKDQIAAANGSSRSIARPDT